MATATKIIAAPPARVGKQGRADKPNIVVFLTDDQDIYLGGWTPMKQATEQLNEKGVTASNWFIHTPVCCPSRAEFLSGRYFHNVRETTPSGGCMHVDEAKVNPVSFPYHLNQNGYNVGYFGKHMNACPSKPPPGFDCPDCYWFANGGGKDGEPGGYLNATFHDQNGSYTANTNGEFAGYTTSVIANKSITWVKKVAATGKPFFVQVAPKAPHVAATPAPWYADEFSDLKAPRTPNYNASSELLQNHHWLIAQQGPITTSQAVDIDNLFRDRWRTLLSVDDAIAAMVQTITDLGLLDNTYFLSTSDHGYQLGQLRLPSCKLNVYENDIRIPMVIKGPGIKPNTTLDYPASNVDVGPTVLGLAGISTPATMDGKSVVPLIVDGADPATPPSVLRHLDESAGTNNAGTWRPFHFVEYYSLGSVTRTGHLVDDPKSNTYRAVRYVGPASTMGNILFAEFTAVTDWHFHNVSFREMFDLNADPYQLNNIYGAASPATIAELTRALDTQYNCQGTSCV